MRNLFDINTIHVEITNACNLECANCTRFIGHHREIFFMDLDQVNNRLLENFILNIRFHEEKISLNESSLDLKKIGKINFYNLSFYERDQKLFAKSEIKFDVIDQEMFYRKFQVSKKYRIDLNKINFEAEYNVDDKIYYLSNINFNENSKKEITFYEVNNIQQLNYIVSKEFKKISSE